MLGANNLRLGFWLTIYTIAKTYSKRNLKLTAKVSLPPWSLDPSLGLKVAPKNIFASALTPSVSTGYLDSHTQFSQLFFSKPAPLQHL